MIHILENYLRRFMYFIQQSCNLAVGILIAFLSSPLAGKRDIVVTIFVRCMCVRQCVRSDLSGP